MTSSSQTIHADVAIVGAGNVGIAVAYYLSEYAPKLKLILIDSDSPMALTSAVSGENYRNWWPHPIMKNFMDRSLTLLNDIDQKAEHSIITNRSGYLLVTRDQHPDMLLDNIQQTFQHDNDLRHHSSAEAYRNALTKWDTGVDVLQSQSDVNTAFPSFDQEAKTAVHIRRGGHISSHSLGSYMLSEIKRRNEGNNHIHKGEVFRIDHHSDFVLHTKTALKTTQEKTIIRAQTVVNAAGPFANQISNLLGVALPVDNILQQKVAFADKEASIDRTLPFTIDLDEQTIDWTEEERAAIREDTDLSFLTQAMPGSIHCRPEGGLLSNKIKMGWAFNSASYSPSRHSSLRNPLLDDHFPEVVLRGAARLHPALKTYYGGFPKDFIHYGGYYTMTPENWPLIGPSSLPGYFMACALSGFGTMASCAAGELTAQHIAGAAIPDYGTALSLSRYQNDSLMKEITSLHSRGIL